VDSITLGILLGESYYNWHPYAYGLIYLAQGLPTLCRMKKLIGGVKQTFSSGPSSRGSGSCSSDGSQDSARSSSSDVVAMDGTDISICSTEEMEKYESLCQ
jgi:hypothetical protein